MPGTRTAAASVSSGASRCGACRQSSTARVTGPAMPRSIASICASVPYWSCSPWISSVGAVTPPSTSSMFQARNSGASQMSFQSRNVRSASRW